MQGGENVAAGGGVGQFSKVRSPLNFSWQRQSIKTRQVSMATTSAALPPLTGKTASKQNLAAGGGGGVGGTPPLSNPPPAAITNTSSSSSPQTTSTTNTTLDITSPANNNNNISPDNQLAIIEDDETELNPKPYYLEGTSPLFWSKFFMCHSLKQSFPPTHSPFFKCFPSILSSQWTFRQWFGWDWLWWSPNRRVWWVVR